MMNYLKLLQFPELEEFTVRDTLYYCWYVISFLIECKNGHPFAVTEVSIVIIMNYMTVLFNSLFKVW